MAFGRKKPTKQFINEQIGDYLVIPTYLLCQLPAQTQHDIISGLETLPKLERGQSYHVRLRGKGGSFIKDPFVK